MKTFAFSPCFSHPPPFLGRSIFQVVLSVEIRKL